MVLLGPNGTPISTNGTNGTSSKGRPPQPTKFLLTPGLSIWRGTVSEEYLQVLKPWSKAFKVFTEMQDDAVIGTLYESVRVPMMDAKFTIEPGGNTSADQDAADFLKSNTIESKAYSWIEHVETALDFMVYGFDIHEKVLEKRRDGRLHIADLLPIGQETLREWGKLNQQGRPESFTQTVIQDGSRMPVTRTAPMSKLLHYVFRGRKRNPIGRSLSRSLYRPWYFSKNLQAVEAIGAERDVGNVPVATLGEGVYDDVDMKALKDGMDGFRIDETAGMILPFGVTMQPFGSGGKVYDIRTMIRDYHHIIRQRFFMDFVSFGSEGVGTQALAKEVTGFFSLSLGAIQREMMDVWNRQLIPWLFQWNNFDIEVLPKIVWAKPGKLNVQSLAQSVVQLLSSGTLHWTKELEDHLRELFEFPPISDEELLEQDRLQLAREKVLGITPEPGIQPVSPAASASKSQSPGSAGGPSQGSPSGGGGAQSSLAETVDSY